MVVGSESADDKKDVKDRGVSRLVDWDSNSFQSLGHYYSLLRENRFLPPRVRTPHNRRANNTRSSEGLRQGEQFYRYYYSTAALSELRQLQNND